MLSSHIGNRKNLSKLFYIILSISSCYAMGDPNDDGPIYRCNTSRTTHDNKFVGGEWYTSPPGRFQWFSKKCNQGWENNNSYDSSERTKTFCNINLTSAQSQLELLNDSGRSMIYESINFDNLTYKIKSEDFYYKSGKKERSNDSGTCELISN